MSASAIEIASVSKAYGSKTVLTGMSLQVPEGSTFALLGRNG